MSDLFERLTIIILHQLIHCTGRTYGSNYVRWNVLL